MLSISSVNMLGTQLKVSPLVVSYALLAAIITALLSRILYMQKFHPLSRFPGPWYATSFSLFGALVSVKGKEPHFLMSLVKKYGSKSLYKCHSIHHILTVHSRIADSHRAYNAVLPSTVHAQDNLLGSTVESESRTIRYWPTWSDSPRHFA
jgi:hypothetical protein